MRQILVLQENIVTFGLVLDDFFANFFTYSIRLQCLEPTKEFSKWDADTFTRFVIRSNHGHYDRSEFPVNFLYCVFQFKPTPSTIGFIGI